MEENIIKLIKSLDQQVDTSNIKYSNNSVDLKDLISLCNFRLDMYNKIELDLSEKNNVEHRDFLNRKIENYNYLKNLGIINIKMVDVNNNIYYFNEDFTKIYLIIDNIKKEVISVY